MILPERVAQADTSGAWRLDRTRRR